MRGVHIAERRGDLLEREVGIEQIIRGLADAHFVQKVKERESRHAADIAAQAALGDIEDAREPLERQLFAGVAVEIAQDLAPVRRGGGAVGPRRARVARRGKRSMRITSSTRRLTTASEPRGPSAGPRREWIPAPPPRAARGKIAASGGPVPRCSRARAAVQYARANPPRRRARRRRRGCSRLSVWRL